MKKILITLLTLMMIIVFTGCGSDNQEKSSSSSSMVSSSTSSKVSSSEQNTNQSSTKIPSPSDYVTERQEMEKALKKALSNYKFAENQTHVSLSRVTDDKLIFSIMPEIIIDDIDENQASTEGIKIIQTLLNSKLPYDVDSYYITIRDSKHHPFGSVTYSPDFDKYTYINNGKQIELNP